MYTLLIVLILIASLLMCFIVLIQESKGGGLASNVASSNQILGVRKTTDVIEKATWGLAIALVVFSIAASYFTPQAQTQQSVIMNELMEQGVTNPVNTPGFTAPIEEAPIQSTTDAE